ncbi:MAG: glycosyltransferase, partial [Robiginitalea sp.]
MRPQVPHAKKLLVIGHRWPEPEATAAGSRMMGMLEGFLKEGYHITFASAAVPGLYGTFASAAVPGLYGIPLEPLGIQTERISLNDSAFNEFLKSNPFEIVLFDRFMTEEQFGWRVRECLPDSTLVLDTEDLHSLRQSREKAIRQDRAWNVESWMTHPHFYREIASILRCDLSLLVSAAERDLLKSHLPILEGKIFYLPFQMKPATEGDPVGFQQRSGFVFLGTGMHRPNLDAIEQLKNRIWPLLSRRLPQAVLRLYGAYRPGQILGFHNPPDRFEVCGWAPS